MSTCETCRFWNHPPSPTFLEGNCKLAERDDSIFRAMAHDEAELLTQKHFGCNQHEPNLHETFSPCDPTTD